MARVATDTGQKITIGPGAKGAISEHIATAWLLQQGFDVFRNVSPNGRADLLAVDWVKNETIRIDVKSQEFSLTAKGPRADAAREIDARNEGFDICYLVVDDNGNCDWYKRTPKSWTDEEANDTWWVDKKTGQRFRIPGVDMSKRQWTFFCHWTLKNYAEFIEPIEASFVKDIAARGIGGGIPFIAEREHTVLDKLRRQVFEGVHRQSEAGDE